MAALFLKKILKQGIIVSLIVSLAFTPVFALENEPAAPEEQAARELPEQQTLKEGVEAADTGGAEEAEETESVAEEPEDVEGAEEIPAISITSGDRNKTEEPVQEYEERANSWRYQNGEILREETSSAPRLYASFTPWTWSSSKGGYLSSNGQVIKGAIRKGVDVSAWQGKIDWAKVKKAGIDFAIIRCGYGDDLTYQDDKRWIRNVQQCEKYGIPYGVYIYSYAASDSQAKSEAKHVLRLLKEAGASPDYPIYYDLEDETVRKCGKKAIVRRAKIFCNAIEAQGYRAGIYANLHWWNNYLNDSSLNQYEKWVAQYYSKCQYEGTYRIWQCASDGKVPGIEGNADINFEFQCDDTNYYMGRWVKDENGKTVFQKPDGTIAKSQWITYKGSKFYVGADGSKAVGFVTIKGSKYYFKNGAMQKSKWLTVSKKKYYASSGGKIVTGYRKIGNYYYGFDSNGAMLTGTKILGGKRYKFMSNGKAHLFKAKTKTRLNYRTGPSTKYKRKGTYKKNKSIAIIRQKSGWGQMTNGYWVKLSYTKKTTKYPQFVAYKAKITAKTTYRTGPSAKYKKKGSYKKGKVVTIKATKNGWGKLSNGYWVKLSYTKRV